jgi:paraquat-inducible protein B
MAKQANPTVVGSFVVGATVLAVAGILVFGGGTFFEEEFRAVAHFEDSVAGLDVGAPVRFRGVEVGSVVDIQAVWTRDLEEIQIPVEMRLVGGRIQDPENVEMPVGKNVDLFLETAVRELGLRAELSQDSIVTGKLFVALSFLPETPIERVGGTTLFEIPTVPSELTELKKSLEDIPLGQLADDAIATLEDVREVLTDPRISELIESISSLARTLDENVEPVAASTRATLDEYRALAQNANAELDAVSEDAQRLLENADSELEPLATSAAGAVEEARIALASINEALGRDRTVLYQLADMLEQMAGAARSIRVLAEYLERHPEALLSGKEGR